MPVMTNQMRSSRISDTLLRLVGPATLFYYVALMYKQQELGLLCMFVMAIPGFLVKRPHVINSQIAVFAILYVFMATVTAFFVDFKDGLYRSIQFTLLLFAILGLVKFWYNSNQEAQDRFVKQFLILTILIFIHMILYHISIGRFTTWKYLYDTKTTTSIMIVVLFTFLTDFHKKVGTTGVLLAIGVLGVLVLASGERKAYMLLGILFLLSVIPLQLKFASGVIGIFLVSVFLLTAPDGSYVKRQLSSAIGLSDQSGDEFENYRHEDLALIKDIGYRSDLIRKYVNENANTLFNENPILGLGAGGYADWARKTYGTDYKGIYGIRMNVHGEINRVPAESGIIGIIISTYCLILYFIFATQNIRLKRINSKTLFPLFQLIFILIYCMFEAIDTNMLSIILSFGLFASVESQKNTSH